MIIFWNANAGFGNLPSTNPGTANVKSGVQYYIDGILYVGSYLPAISQIGPFAVPLPNVFNTLLGYFQNMVFTTVVKTVVNFQEVETPTDTGFLGVWQPFSIEELRMKPEGQRSWKWFMLHADVTLVLKVDDIVTYEGTQYRVMQKNDYLHYGYFEYHLIEDWTPT